MQGASRRPKKGLWKSCGCAVHFLLSERQQNFFSGSAARKLGRASAVDGPSSRASLDRRKAARKIRVAPQQSDVTDVATDFHRFEQSIAGRHYLIEVLPVAHDRWRACLARMPGVPTAMMPFYGSTPDEAARHLSEWLTRAYQRTAGPVTPV